MSKIEIHISGVPEDGQKLHIVKYNWRRIFFPLQIAICWTGKTKLTWWICSYVGDPLWLWIEKGSTTVLSIPITNEQAGIIQRDAWGWTDEE